MLLQELAETPWQVLVACVILNRSRGSTARRIFRRRAGSGFGPSPGSPGCNAPVPPHLPFPNGRIR